MWSQERETRDNESVYQDKTEHFGVEGDKQRLLFSEINPNTNKRRYAHPGDKIDHIAVTYQGDTEPKDYQRWTGGYCYPVGGQSALAQPSWDRWVDADVKGTVGRYSWDCTNDPEKVWYTHTYGPFKKHEMEKYYFFVIPRRRHEEPRPMSYGLLWWWSDDPKARAKDWKTAKGGAKSPIDAYHPWVTPETHYKDLENLKYEGKSYYRMKPPAKYFRVSFYQWVIGLYEYENWAEMEQRLLDKGVPPIKLPKNIKGKRVEDDLWPPHQVDRWIQDIPMETTRIMWFSFRRLQRR